MSEHKIQGSDMLLFIDPTGGTNYDTVVCLTSLSQTDSVQPVDASSACGPDKSPGAVDLSISFEGQHLQDPLGGTISGTNLLQLLRAEQTIGWKLSPVTPQAGDEIQEGTGYISELSSTYNYAEIGVFSGTIQPYGLPTVTINGGGGGGGLSLGQNHEGGTIAYLDNTGLHGFVIYQDLGQYKWQILPLINTGATGTAINTGSTNTDNIINSGANSDPIYFICFASAYNGYSDWVWPSIDEMAEIVNNQSYYPGILTSSNYWSSTETDANNAFKIDTSGTETALSKTTFAHIIPLRYF